jgi:hypothetical protein
MCFGSIRRSDRSFVPYKDFGEKQLSLLSERETQEASLRPREHRYTSVLAWETAARKMDVSPVSVGVLP